MVVATYRSIPEAFFGGSQVLSISSPLQLTWGTKLWDITPTGATQTAILPDARGQSFGVRQHRRHFRPGQSFMIVNGSGSQTLNVQDGASNFLVAIAHGTATQFTLVDGSTQAGVWTFVSDIYAQVGRGATIADGRKPFTIDIEGSGYVYYAGGAREDLISNYGWDAVTPVALRIIVGASAVRGSLSQLDPAISTGQPWPAGSTFMLINRGIITGKGGDGGASGFITTAGGVGQDGGPAFKTYVDITVVNLGTLQGGGGGGGGGGADLVTGTYYEGGGGGGGAGHLFGVGGGIARGPGVGGNGNENAGGAGGAPHPGAAGGNGANPGAVGSAGSNGSSSNGGAGGAAGPYMQVLTGKTVTYIGTGTRLGASVFF